MDILRLLWFTADGVTLIERRDGALLEPRHFPPGEEAALARSAAGMPPGRWRVVVERGEEECRLERLPRLRGGDRRRLLAATAERLFPDTPYRHRQRLRASGREELWSFSALADPRPLRALLAALKGVGVERITSPTRLLPTLLERLGETAGERLVAWRAFGAGVRLVLLRRGRPAALRLAPPEASIEEELSATRGYLERLGEWPEGAAEPLRLTGDGEGSPFADPLFAALALEARLPPGYDAAPPWRAAAPLRRLLLAATLAAAGWQAATALEAQRSALAAERMLVRLRSHGESAMDAGGATAERLVAAVERAAGLRPFALSAAPPLRRLGRCLEAYPEVRLERLVWRADEQGTLTLELAGRLPAEGAAARVAALARRLGGEPGVVEAVVSRPPPPVEGFEKEVGELPFALRLEARVEDGWGREPPVAARPEG